MRASLPNRLWTCYLATNDDGIRPRLGGKMWRLRSTMHTTHIKARSPCTYFRPNTFGTLILFNMYTYLYLPSLVNSTSVLSGLISCANRLTVLKHPNQCPSSPIQVQALKPTMILPPKPSRFLSIYASPAAGVASSSSYLVQQPLRRLGTHPGILLYRIAGDLPGSTNMAI